MARQIDKKVIPVSVNLTNPAKLPGTPSVDLVVLDKEKILEEAKRKQKIVLAITIVSAIIIIALALWFTRKKK